GEYVCPLEPAVTLTARSPKRLFHLVFESHDGRALVPSPKRSESPASDIDTGVVDGLKALDPEWPIREADIEGLKSRSAAVAARRSPEARARFALTHRWPRSDRGHLATQVRDVTRRLLSLPFSWRAHV